MEYSWNKSFLSLLTSGTFEETKMVDMAAISNIFFFFFFFFFFDTYSWKDGRFDSYYRVRATFAALEEKIRYSICEQ